MFPCNYRKQLNFFLPDLYIEVLKKFHLTLFTRKKLSSERFCFPTAKYNWIRTWTLCSSKASNRTTLSKQRLEKHLAHHKKLVSEVNEKNPWHPRRPKWMARYLNDVTLPSLTSSMSKCLVERAVCNAKIVEGMTAWFMFCIYKLCPAENQTPRKALVRNIKFPPTELTKEVITKVPR